MTMETVAESDACSGKRYFYIYTMCAGSERAFAVRFFSIDKNRVLAESIDCDARFYIRGVADIE